MLNIFKFFGQSHAVLGHIGQTLFFPLQIQSINHSINNQSIISNQSINLLIKVLLGTANTPLGLLGGSVTKESTCNAEHLHSIPESGRPLGEENGNPLQYSCLENPMDRGAWWATVHRVAKNRI